MTTLTKIISDIRKKLSGATAELQSEIAHLRDAIKEKRTALSNAQHAPLPLEEIRTERIPRAVAIGAQMWLHRHGASLVYGQRSLGSPKSGGPDLPWAHTDPLPWGALCAAHPELAHSILGALMATVSYEPGPASSERPALIEKLEHDLAALEATEEALIDEAAASGVTITHRPEVVQRRQAEARQRQRAEGAAANRKAREAALNAQHEEDRARGRAVVRSSYLETAALLQD